MTLPIRLAGAALLAALFLTGPAFAADPVLPEWDQLSDAQREQLTAPIRDRWNSADPERRTGMLERAQRWNTLTPPQRRHAHHGVERWQHMSPEQRTEARALYREMRSLAPEARKAWKAEWRAMTIEQRKAWVDAHPAPEKDDRD